MKFKVRSERSGMGTGRVYTVVYTAMDSSGNEKTATATVTVPHDQSGHQHGFSGFAANGSGFDPGAETSLLPPTP